MFSYHGWLATYEVIDHHKIIREVNLVNGGKPISVEFVNGETHISFSGNHNRDLGQLESIVKVLKTLPGANHGCIYLNDANNPEMFNKLEFIKIVNGQFTKMLDQNFTSKETQKIFE